MIIGSFLRSLRGKGGIWPCAWFITLRNMVRNAWLNLSLFLLEVIISVEVATIC